MTNLLVEKISGLKECSVLPGPAIRRYPTMMRMQATMIMRLLIDKFFILLDIMMIDFVSFKFYCHRKSLLHSLHPCVLRV